jgi:hypothetical protein
MAEKSVFFGNQDAPISVRTAYDVLMRVGENHMMCEGEKE